MKNNNFEYINEKKEADIYQIIENNTPDYKYEDSFVDGDLSERIEEWPYYRECKDFNLKQLDNEEWSIDEDVVDEYVEKIKKDGINQMPPIVLSNDLSIIDGIHRLNALLKCNIDKINVYIGFKQKMQKKHKMANFP